ncbi:MAG: transcriptional regulator [Gammaproteobacteria bacterium HGW-Gammaproteobacteria-2]|jgi:transcriptional regulator with XRE-family HTH domain|nr:MAG: transcriptional regulator [Gammaproteobacteria bacterium HGW-Gammaproteobacteria-2]
MKIDNSLTDERVLKVIGERLLGIRLARNLTQAELAEQAGVSKRTVERLESGAVAIQLSGFVRVCRALGLLERLELLIPEPAPSPMMQLKRQGKPRQRASGDKATDNSKPWTWGENTP